MSQSYTHSCYMITLAATRLHEGVWSVDRRGVGVLEVGDTYDWGLLSGRTLVCLLICTDTATLKEEFIGRFLVTIHNGGRGDWCAAQNLKCRGSSLRWLTMS